MSKKILVLMIRSSWLLVLYLSYFQYSSTVNAKPTSSDADDELDQIFGGNVVKRGAHQYMAHVRLFTSNTSMITCGGTVISERHILTAAHCVARKPFFKVVVLLRVYNLNPRDASAIVRYVNNEDIRMHQYYDSQTTRNDIAILKLNQTIDFNDVWCENGTCTRVEKVNLPPARTGYLYDGQIATAVGWGSSYIGGPGSSVLQEAKLEVIHPLTCQISWALLAWTELDYELQMCVYAYDKGVCQGDSGGPIVMNGTQLGIASFVSRWGCDAMGAVFTRVSYYVDNGWIAANMI